MSTLKTSSSPDTSRCLTLQGTNILQSGQIRSFRGPEFVLALAERNQASSGTDEGARGMRNEYLEDKLVPGDFQLPVVLALVEHLELGARA